jgi:hypothetical protein
MDSRGGGDKSRRLAEFGRVVTVNRGDDGGERETERRGVRG